MTKATKPQRNPRGTGGTFVHETLRQRILNLEIEPGAVLDELQLARVLGVSRSPVREALQKLAAAGLVETFPNRSAIVAHIKFEAITQFLSAQDIVYRLTARGAAQRARPEDVKALRKINAEHAAMRRAGNKVGMIDLNRDFHTAVARVAGNSWYKHWLEALLDENQRLLHYYMRAMGGRIPYGEVKHHKEIIDAIGAGNADAAEEAARLDADVLRRQLVGMFSLDAVPIKLEDAAP